MKTSESWKKKSHWGENKIIQPEENTAVCSKGASKSASFLWLEELRGALCWFGFYFSDRKQTAVLNVGLF